MEQIAIGHSRSESACSPKEAATGCCKSGGRFMRKTLEALITSHLYGKE